MTKLYLIREDASIIDALIHLNELHSVSMTLFVVDGENHMIGTLTDGDVRRALIRGINPSSRVRDIMHKEFKYISDKNNIEYLRNLSRIVISLVPVL